jgi:hypothetical protein
MPLGMRPEEDFRISLAGAQEKTALLNFEGKWHLPLGPTPTSHILKLPIGYNEHSGMDLSDSVENEWLCHLILKQYGISIAGAGIHEFDGVKVLVVERFDRRWAKDGSWLMRLPVDRAAADRFRKGRPDRIPAGFPGRLERRRHGRCFPCHRLSHYRQRLLDPPVREYRAIPIV